MKSPSATTLTEAQAALDVRPLWFLPDVSHVATRPEFYVEAPKADRRTTRSLSDLRSKLLDSNESTKLFLSGHVGSGKSTELNRLLIDAALKQKYWLVKLRFEEQEVATLDASQVLFAMAAAIHERASREGLLGSDGEWHKKLRWLDEKIYGAQGITAGEGTVSAELNLVFVKLKQDLRLSDKRRQQFRELGETQQSVLKDLLTGIADDVKACLARDKRPSRLLLLIDDLDKVRGAAQQKDIFDTNLSLLFVPSFPVLYTVPTGLAYGGDALPEVRQRLIHLYPRRILEKAAGLFDPEKAFKQGSEDFFHDALAARADPALFEPEAIRLAVVYSGGVLREYFRLLGNAVAIARETKLERVDVPSMRETIKEERLRETMGLYTDDWQALVQIHRTNELRRLEDRRLLDLSRVLECHNDEIFYEVNPLLWASLEKRSADAPLPART